MSDNDIEVELESLDRETLQPKWFALQTLSNQENKIKKALENMIVEKDWQDVVLEILVPSEKVTEIKNGKKYARVRKFFPGYVFVKMQLMGEDGEVRQDVVYNITRIDGAVRFVGGREPSELKPSEVEDILNKVQAVSGKSVPKVNYEIGETVKINDGPFLDLTGVIEAIDTEEGKLRVNVSMFGRSTPVDLEFWQVKRFTEEDN